MLKHKFIGVSADPVSKGEVLKAKHNNLVRRDKAQRDAVKNTSKVAQNNSDRENSPIPSNAGTRANSNHRRGYSKPTARSQLISPRGKLDERQGSVDSKDKNHANFELSFATNNQKSKLSSEPRDDARL